MLSSVVQHHEAKQIRGDIEGLRAVAILLVVAFHIGDLGCSLIAFVTKRLELDALGDLMTTSLGTEKLSVNNRELECTMFRGPSNELVEVIVIGAR